MCPSISPPPESSRGGPDEERLRAGGAAIQRRYLSIMGRAVAVVLGVSAALFVYQSWQQGRMRLDEIDARTRDRLFTLERSVDSIGDQVSALRLKAETYRRLGGALRDSAALYATLIASIHDGYLTLDTLPPSLDWGEIGNLTAFARSPDPAFRDDVEMALAMTPMMRAITDNLPDARWVYYVSGQGFVYCYPAVPSGQYRITPNTLGGAVYQAARPETNPDGERRWTEVYRDAGTGEPTVSVVEPLVIDGAFRGALAIDVVVESLRPYVATSGADDLIDFAIVGADGRLLARTGQDHDPLDDGETIARWLPALTAAAGGAPLDRAGGAFVLAGGQLVRAYPVAGSPWRLVVRVSLDRLLIRLLAEDSLVLGPLLLGMLGILGVAVRATRRQFIQPTAALIDQIAQEAAGRTVACPADLPPGWRPWFAIIRSIFDDQAELHRIRQELDVARRMQAGILPARFPDRPEVALFGRMLAAYEVGGDFFDYFRLDDHRIGVVIADVSGKGIAASLFMAVSRTVLRGIAPTCAGPAECLARVNTVLEEGNDRGTFVTVFYGVFDTRDGTLTYANGGHNPPLLLRRDGTVVEVPSTGGLVLGVFGDMPYAEATVTLDEGEAVILYTDGVVEAFDAAGALYGTERLRAVVAAALADPPEAIVDAIYHSVAEYAAGAAQSDDITCLVLRRGIAGA